jgi:hypothetical protein
MDGGNGGRGGSLMMEILAGVTAGCSGGEEGGRLPDAWIDAVRR